MIDEIISEIRAAEEKADQMQKDAYQEGKDIVLQAELEAESIKKNTVLECKEAQKAAAAAAEAKAASKRNDILKKGEQAAKQLIDDKSSAVEQQADSIVQLILDKYKA
ncbi:MAG: hypothetical protein MJ068_00485 [Clostridia bacterium]|nr:hypothetical protein [Clostridia bacterium]